MNRQELYQRCERALTRQEIDETQYYAKLDETKAWISEVFSARECGMTWEGLKRILSVRCSDLRRSFLLKELIGEGKIRVAHRPDGIDLYHWVHGKPQPDRDLVKTIGATHYAVTPDGHIAYFSFQTEFNPVITCLHRWDGKAGRWAEAAAVPKNFIFCADYFEGKIDE